MTPTEIVQQGQGHGNLAPVFAKGRNIVLLSDGTGNSAAKMFKTNIWRLYEALDLSPGSNQVAFYDDGVGTSTLRPLVILGGALGFGLKRNVKQLYTFLCRNYEQGDGIYACGFSRGAFTIRVLVGLISTQGVIPGRDMHPDELRRQVNAAYAADRKDYKTSWGHWRKQSAATATNPDRKIPSGRLAAQITFLGLWDTVDAYGLPIDELKRGLDYWLLGLSFPDQDLSPIVKRACHALALDDERRTFHPVLWNERVEKDLVARGLVEKDRISQVWFAGMHSNVGGGYPKDALAHVSLNWMINEATKTGLKLDPLAIAQFKHLENAHADMGNSRSGPAAYYRYDPRRVSNLCNDNYNKVWIDKPKIHHSVLDRIQTRYVDYVPHVIPANYEVVGPTGTVMSNPYENQSQAQAREQNLESAWDLVWWRRLVYFITLALTMLLVLFPWLWPVEGAVVCQGRWCFLEPVVLAIGKFIPSSTEFWLEAFRVHMTRFVVLTLALAVATGWGLWLAKRIAAHACWAWVPVSGMTISAPSRWRPWSWVARQLRTSDRLVALYRLVARSVLPFLFFLATAMLAVIAANRLGFEFGEATGLTCTSTNARDLRSVEEGSVTVDIPFETANPCFATRVRLDQKGVYRITLRINEAWIDGSRTTTPAGFTTSEAGWRFRLGVPFRRSWNANWFEPIARIEHTGRDRYRLSPRRVPRTDEPVYVSQPFTTHTTGELFLFVNDVAIGLPFVWDWFYTSNNRGRAEITINRIAPAQPQ